MVPSSKSCSDSNLEPSLSPLSHISHTTHQLLTTSVSTLVQADTSSMTFQFIYLLFNSCSFTIYFQHSSLGDLFKKWDHVAPSNKTLWCLPITFRIKTMIFTITCRTIYNLAPLYCFALFSTILLLCSALAIPVSFLFFGDNNGCCFSFHLKYSYCRIYSKFLLKCLVFGEAFSHHFDLKYMPHTPHHIPKCYSLICFSSEFITIWNYYISLFLCLLTAFHAHPFHTLP